MGKDTRIESQSISGNNNMASSHILNSNHN